jgi:hypothetical protein
MLLALYIGKNNLQAAPLWGMISQATTLTPIGSLLGEGLAHIAAVGDPARHGEHAPSHLPLHPPLKHHPP